MGDFYNRTAIMMIRVYALYEKSRLVLASLSFIALATLGYCLVSLFFKVHIDFSVEDAGCQWALFLGASLTEISNEVIGCTPYIYVNWTV